MVALLVGLIGGVAMGSMMLGRSTQSAYPRFLATTNPSGLTLSTYGIEQGAPTSYSAKLEAAIARLPEVKRVESWVGVFAVPLERDGAPNLALANEVNLAASKDGLYFDIDRATAIAGRMANPKRADEFVTTALGARLMGAHLGEVLPVGLYGPKQAALPGFGTPRVPPAKRFNMRLVGIVEFNNQVVQDDTDVLPTNLVYTPAFARLVPDAYTNGTWYGIQLAPGYDDISSVEQDLLRVLPPGAVGNFNVTALTEAKVERAVKPESVALGAFGLIAALAALGTALPVIARQLRRTEDERRVLRALGAGRAATLVDGLAGSVLAVVTGSLLAVVVAVGLSPLGPLGPVRRVYHPAGLVFDWTVLGLGLVALAGLSSLAALYFAWRSLPHRVARLGRLRYERPSLLAGRAAAAGLPLPGVVGFQFAVKPASGGSSVSSRWAMVGAAVAVMTLTATMTFSASLDNLVKHPSLYGWAWDYTLTSVNGVPPPALKALSRDHDVAAWSGFTDASLRVDGQTVPALVGHGKPAVGPPLLSGHGLDGSGQIVLGPETLASLHKRVGATVTVSYGAPNTAPLYLPPFPVRVVGTATFPAVAGSATFADHTTMGSGAMLEYEDIPAGFRRATQSPDPTLNGPALVFIRLRPGVSHAAALKGVQAARAAGNAAFARDPRAAGDEVEILPVQRPAEIVNYQSTGGTPVVLAVGLASGAAVALALSLSATVRDRRRDLALLKTLGFTRSQLASTLVWQATVTALAGVAVGVPLGAAVGRQLWALFARDINVVPRAAVPLSLALVAVGVVLLANLVAAAPGRAAATTPAAVVLREE